MKILTLETVPAHTWPYQSAAPRGGTEIVHFPLLRGTADRLPEDVAAM